MKKVALAIDSFKGSLSSREAEEAFEQGFRRAIPDCEVVKVEIADGGEGTVETLTEALGGRCIDIEVHDPLHRPITARYGTIEGGRVAIIEMAAASGLALLAPEERNPLLTSTYGTGEMIADAIQRGCRKVLLGIGGSATNDGGVGALRALGFRFLDCRGEELCGGGEILAKIDRIEYQERYKELSECEFTIACDVTNPLYGASGAAYVFAPQKGADEAMVEALDRGLRNFARVVEGYNGSMIGELQGAGAAGGLGGGLKALLDARLVRGIDMVLEAVGFADKIKGCDLVVTGEGRIDRQTLMGKAPSGVLAVAMAQGIPTIAIGGSVVWCEELRRSGFAAIEATTPEGMPLNEAMKPSTAKDNIIRTAECIARRFTTN